MENKLIDEAPANKEYVNKDRLSGLITEVEKLHNRHELAKTTGPDYFEPGMMEYLEQSDGSYDADTGILSIQFESRGTRYDGRTEQIERVNIGDEVVISREETNPFNHNNFRLLTAKERDIGNMPAELCNVIAPLYDAGSLVIESAQVSFVEPISKRSRHAKQAILFVKMSSKIVDSD